MNRRDELIQHAFGELREDRSRRLDAGEARNPQLAREAEALRTLRDDLRSLRDVPECQLSTERMRDAVLRSEMKARPRLSPAWLGVPVAAGIALLGFLFVRTADVPQAASTKIIEEGSRTVATMGLAAETLLMSGAESALSFAGVAKAEVPAPAVASPSAAPITTRRTMRTASRIVNRKPRAETPIVRFDQPAGPVGPVAAATPDANPSESAGIVIIDTPDSSGETRANEVETASHVVIGG